MFRHDSPDPGVVRCDGGLERGRHSKGPLYNDHPTYFLLPRYVRSQPIRNVFC